MKYLEKGVSERGLEPASLRFVREQRNLLELQDSAVLSGVMENVGAELALVVRLRQDENKASLLTLILYSIASDMGDSVVLKSGDLDGLGKEFDEFLNKWKGQERSKTPAIGARVADRTDGGVEVISVLPGFPAASAGLVPGDIIVSSGTAEIKGKKDLEPLLKSGEGLEIKFIDQGNPRSAQVVPVDAPSETPLDAYGYLYNLILVDNTKSVDGNSALNLGNAYFHFGDFEKAAKTYQGVDTGTKTGVCTGTALFRLGQANEKLGRWVDAAGAYRKALMRYPYATLGNADGPFAAQFAKERLQELYSLGLVK